MAMKNYLKKCYYEEIILFEEMLLRRNYCHAWKQV